MDAVIGRSAELAALAESWDHAVAGRPQLVALWGRRRVGKTFLLTHFARGRPHVYFTATRQDSEQRQVKRLYGRAVEQLGGRGRLLELSQPSDWEAALRVLVETAASEPLLVVIDEMPRLLDGRPDFADLLSAVWENHVRDQRLMLVVTGSAVSTMEEVLGGDGGLRGRPQLELRLDPFPAVEARAFLPDLSAEQFVVAYSVCGGYPLHLQRWDPGRDAEDNLERLAFSPDGVLLTDAFDIMSEDLDWRSGYERVLAAIATITGVRRGKIANRANQRVDYTLARLQRAGYVRAETPLGSGPGTAPLYAVDDVYLAFWLSVLRADAELIDGGQGRAVLARRRPVLDRHVSAVFERLAREHAIRLVPENLLLPADTVIGRWWRDEEVEIDVLGLAGESVALVGEAKWRAGPVDAHDLRELHRKAALLTRDAGDPQLAFWTRSGLRPDIAAAGVWGFGPADLLGDGESRSPVRRWSL